MKVFSWFISVVLLNIFCGKSPQFRPLQQAFFKGEAEEKSGLEGTDTIATKYEQNQNKQSSLYFVLADMVSRKDICFSSYLGFFVRLI